MYIYVFNMRMYVNPSIEMYGSYIYFHNVFKSAVFYTCSEKTVVNIFMFQFPSISMFQVWATYNNHVLRSKF